MQYFHVSLIREFDLELYFAEISFKYHLDKTLSFELLQNPTLAKNLPFKMLQKYTLTKHTPLKNFKISQLYLQGGWGKKFKSKFFKKKIVFDI